MNAAPLELSADGSRVTVHIPIAIKYRRGRRSIVLPELDQLAERTPRATERFLVKAIARAHRWKRLLETGEFASVIELAAAEKINHPYLCRVFRLTLLAPEIVEAIRDGRQPPSLDLNALLKPFPYILGGAAATLLHEEPVAFSLNALRSRRGRQFAEVWAATASREGLQRTPHGLRGFRRFSTVARALLSTRRRSFLRRRPQSKQ